LFDPYTDETYIPDYTCYYFEYGTVAGLQHPCTKEFLFGRRH